MGMEYKAAFLAALFFPCLASADEWINSDQKYFDLDTDQMQTMGLLPRSMMDDEALLELAEALRNNSSSHTQHRLNVYWLLAEHVDRSKYRNVFKQNLSNALWRLTQKNRNSEEADKERSKYAHQYRFRFKDDQFALNYVVPF